MDTAINTLKTEVKVLDERTKALEKKVDTFDGIKEVLVELKILTTQQIEGNTKRDGLLREQGIALTKAVETMNGMSEKQDRHEKQLEKLDSKFCDSNDRGVIHISEVVKKVLYIGVSAVVGAILASVLINLG